DCPAYVVDPPVVDEMWPVARISGLAEIQRTSLFHALNQKAVARIVAGKMGKSYNSVNLIVAHLGGGITVGAHRKGRVVDVNNGVNGEGPFSPERAGGLPLNGVLGLLKEGRYSVDQFLETISRRAGCYSYLGTVDIREVEAKAGDGDARAALVLDAMIYQIAKEIGGLAAALDGEVDGIVLTGAIAYNPAITDMIRRKVGFIADLYLEPGDYEIEALVSGALRVLSGEEQAREYL
ncbi:MAG: butyrate kinase, partial [Deltaproteobacteria bacterium]|nr:butyrate kinase [Deltaproteobacteria bacterium]